MISANLKELREEAELTQSEVAKELNISAQSVSKWERGEALPSIEFLPKLAELYDCEINDFFSKPLKEPVVDEELKDFSYELIEQTCETLKKVYVDCKDDVELKEFAKANQKSLCALKHILAYVKTQHYVSISSLIRKYNIGYGRAGYIVDGLEKLKLTSEIINYQRVVFSENIEKFITFLQKYIKE